MRIYEVLVRVEWPDRGVELTEVAAVAEMEHVRRFVARNLPTEKVLDVSRSEQEEVVGSGVDAAEELAIQDGETEA